MVSKDTERDGEVWIDCVKAEHFYNAVKSTGKKMSAYKDELKLSNGQIARFFGRNYREGKIKRLHARVSQATLVRFATLCEIDPAVLLASTGELKLGRQGLAPTKVVNYSRYVWIPEKDNRDVEDLTQPREPLVDRITYVKFTDESGYSFVDNLSGRLANQGPNRAFSLASIDEDGTQIWNEWNLRRFDSGRYTWKIERNHVWVEIVANSDKIIAGRNGTLLRRTVPLLDAGEGRQKLLEAFLPTPTANDGVLLMCYRWTIFDPSDLLLLRFKPGGNEFDMCVGPISKILRD